MPTLAVIVMEPGGDWPGQVGDSTSFVGFCREGEDLVGKTQANLAALDSSRQRVRVAVLACNDATDSAASRRRARLARVLLGAVTGTTCGRLILSSKRGASTRMRQELLGLAGALTEELRGTTATISLRFDGAASGRSAPLMKTYAVTMTEA